MHKEWIVIPVTAATAWKVLAISGLLTITTGCIGHTSTGPNFTATGTPEGWDAFTRNITSLMKTPKETARQPNQYFALDKARDEQVTKRDNKDSWLQSWVKGVKEND